MLHNSVNCTHLKTHDQILCVYQNGLSTVLSLEHTTVIASLVITLHSAQLMNVLMLTLEHPFSA